MFEKPSKARGHSAAMRAVHVLGIAHSGTTIVDRILSSYGGVVGLGEAQQMWKKIQRGTLRDRHNCPCGQSHNTCPFWGGLLHRAYSQPEDFFRSLVERGRDLGFQTIVDTSKALLSSTSFASLRNEGVLDALFQIRLVRDPRGWVSSMIRRNDIDRRDLNAVRALFYRWLFSYVKLDSRALEGTTVIYLWYDKLILEQSQNRLADLMGLTPPEGGEIDLARAQQHAIAGNKFVHSSGRERLRYDSSWLGDTVLDEVYAGLPAVRAYYHEAQKLHLRDDSRMVSEHSVVVDQRVIDEAQESGQFDEIERQANLLGSRSVQLSPGTA